MDCLICLAPCDTHVIRCRNAHAMHRECFTDMVRNMAKTDCPYCSAHVPAVKTLRFPSPNPFKRALILVEHWIFAFVLVPNYMFRYRAAWTINKKLMQIRLKFDNVAPLKNEIKDFRSTMIGRILKIIPTIMVLVELASRPGQFVRSDAVKLLGIATYLL